MKDQRFQNAVKRIETDPELALAASGAGNSRPHHLRRQNMRHSRWRRQKLETIPAVREDSPEPSVVRRAADLGPNVEG